MNIYTIYKSPAKDSVQTGKWDIYFKTVTYEEGIRFLQAMDNVTNAVFTMLKTKEETVVKHAYTMLRESIIMNEFDAAAQAGQAHPYEIED